MKRILWCFPPLILFCLLLSSFAQDDPPKVLQSVDSEAKQVALFLTSQVEIEIIKAKAEDREPDFSQYKYFKFFTSYTVSNEKIQKLIPSVLSFVLNSCASYKSIRHIKKPTQINDTLFAIDIRDYGWSLDDWERIAGIDPYFAEPIVDHRLYNYNRLLSGNSLFRADWFIVHATDATKQTDRKIDDIIYYLLLYGKGNEPKDADDFRRIWEVDLKTIRIKQVERGSVIDQGKSGVSRHARQVRRGRTIFGCYHETRDVKSYEEKLLRAESEYKNNFILKDFIEDIFANHFDAQEFITSDRNRLQVYQLGNNVGKRLEEADAGIVWDRVDANDPRVRTAKGCMVCHAVGINPVSNAVADIFRRGGKLNFKTKELNDAVEAFYLSDLDSDIEDDNRLYARAVKECNGLTPEENAAAYEAIYNWYMGPVTPTQAAFECGMTYRDYKLAIKPLTIGRLDQLYYGIDIPRESWDSLNSGGYITSMLLIKKLDLAKIAKEVIRQPAAKIVKRIVEVESSKGQGLNRVALVIFEVPESAKVYIEGELSRTTGTRRLFYTPELSVEGYYDVKIVEGESVIKKRISVKPGYITKVRLAR
jgi:hypothetical protein